jgi:TolB-like protein/Flp pilus assembly protein TadD
LKESRGRRHLPVAAAYDQVRGKIDVAAQDLGERRLKNIAEPVRVYAISPTARASPLPHTTRVQRLSIVVLPLANLGGDSEHDYFVDGIAESLTTDLSRIPGAFVIARNTAFTYKGRTIDVRQLGDELGIRYAIEGSVQRSGTRLRVNVELLDTESGGHLWAERFDRDTGELFDIQDEIVARVARALDVELTAAEARRAKRGYAADLDSIDFTFRGYAAFNRSLSPENLTEADQFFETALTLEPRNAQALVGRALARLAFASSYTKDERATHLARAETAAIQALALAPNYAKAHRALGEIYIYTNRTMLGIAELEQAIALDRNHAHAYAMLGLAQVALGHAQEAAGRIAQAFRLSPRDAFAYLWCTNAGAAKLLLGRDDEAVVWLGRAIETNRTYPLTHFLLAAALAQQGQAAKARIAAAAGLALNPTFTIRRYRQGALSDNPTHLAQRERVIEGLRRAAVPEE